MSAENFEYFAKNRIEGKVFKIFSWHL
jgi:hypothetical protein